MVESVSYIGSFHKFLPITLDVNAMRKQKTPSRTPLIRSHRISLHLSRPLQVGVNSVNSSIRI